MVEKEKGCIVHLLKPGVEKVEEMGLGCCHPTISLKFLFLNFNENKQKRLLLEF